MIFHDSFDHINNFIIICDRIKINVFLNTRNYIQGRLNSIIGPRAKQYTGAHTYTTTRRKKTVNVKKIKHVFIVWVLPTRSALIMSEIDLS
jgi:hypothetical protein